MKLRFLTRLTRPQKAALLLGLDGLTALAALVLALAVQEHRAPRLAEAPFLLAAMMACLLTSHYLGLHRMQLLAYEKHGLIETALTAVAIGAGLALANLAAPPRLGTEAILLTSLLFLVLSYFGRVALLHLATALYNAARAHRRVLIYGAGRTGRQLAAALGGDDRIRAMGFIDDNPRKQSLTLAGLQVYSPLRLPRLIQQLRIEAIVLALPAEGRHRKAQTLAALDCEVLTLPSFAELLSGRAEIRRPGSPPLQSLLGRDRRDTDLPSAAEAYRGQTVLISGAGGSIGSELCRQIAALSPARLVLLDHGELALYTITRELTELWPDLPLRPVLGSVCQEDLLRQVFNEEAIGIVLHAAAYKHVPLVQANPLEGLRNNVLGTRALAGAAARAGVGRFLLISSDKAVRPSGVMGASKRLSEEIVQDLAARRPDTAFSIVRFGNVLGSSGSVIPLFEDQIARGGPVTVTHPEVTRYFMTVTEAVRLVLIAGSFEGRGDVFALDMGQPVPILQVARQMILGAGLPIHDGPDSPADAIRIRFTGLRPGEKLHEELFIGADLQPTPHPRILRAREVQLSQLEVAAALQELRRAIDTRDETAATAALHRWVRFPAARASDRSLHR